MSGEGKTYLLSYPRSGNSWVRYFAEFASGRQTLGCSNNPDDVPLYQNRLAENPLVHVDGTLPPILHKSHGRDIQRDAHHRMILIVRDPSTAIRRQAGRFSWLQAIRYVYVLRLYDRWPGRKHLVRYSELVSRPNEVFTKLAQFLGIQPEPVADFISRLDDHRKASIALYSGAKPVTGIVPKGVSHTRGKPAPQRVRRWDMWRIKALLWLTLNRRLDIYFDG